MRGCANALSNIHHASSAGWSPGSKTLPDSLTCSQPNLQTGFVRSMNRSGLSSIWICLSASLKKPRAISAGSISYISKKDQIVFSVLIRIANEDLWVTLQVLLFSFYVAHFCLQYPMYVWHSIVSRPKEGLQEIRRFLTSKRVFFGRRFRRRRAARRTPPSSSIKSSASSSSNSASTSSSSSAMKSSKSMPKISRASSIALKNEILHRCYVYFDKNF